MKYSDEFIKERERYAIIGDDLDIAFVGQKKNALLIIRFYHFECNFENTIFNFDFNRNV